MQRLFIIIGILFIVIGIAWSWIKKLNLGHLPGDIIIKKENFSFYFPIVTCIIISVVISIVLWILKR